MAECHSQRQAKKIAQLNRILMKEEQRAKVKQVSSIMRKPTWDRTDEDQQVLQKFPEITQLVQNRMQKTRCLKDRYKEAEDPPNVLREKCKQLSEAISKATSLVVYTGAGISTAAEIPDYRGPQGVWTLLQKGHHVSVKDLSNATPTFTHMAITSLYKAGLISHVVSQNCDGLHLRSGLPRSILSEVHGNMFIEVCPKCRPLRQYVRLFDVTERTGFHKHKTGRKCHKCNEELTDTIVHFGERGKLRWPLNWEGAGKAVENCDMILCLGSSLKVLRKYPCLWAMDRPPDQRPPLYIVNLQWTPKDDQAVLKINGRCDDVMKEVVNFLNLEITEYVQEKDPIFRLATPLKVSEFETTTRQHLIPPKKADCSLKTRRTSPRKSNSCIGDIKLESASVLCDHTYFERLSPKIQKVRETEEQDGKVSTKLEQPEPDRSERKVFSDNSSLLQAQIILEPLDLSKYEHLNLTIKEKNHMEQEDDEKSLKDKTLASKQTLTGWFGKGCSKWRKVKRKKV